MSNHTAPLVASALESPEPAAGRSPTHAALRAVARSPLVAASAAVVVGLVAVALLAPFLARFPSGYGSVTEISLPPSPGHPFGTDDLGLDILAQVVWGARVSMMAGMLASTVAVALGVPLGLAAGFYRGWLDTLISGAIDVFLTLPILPLMVLVAAVLGSSIWNVILIIGAFSWPQIARVVRAETLRSAELPYIEAARAVGAMRGYILWRHLFPNVVSVAVVNWMLTLGRAVLSEAGLAFLGLGDPQQWSWGRILHNAQRSGAFMTNWWQTLFPSLAILLLVTAATLLGTALNDALNPRLRRGGAA